MSNVYSVTQVNNYIKGLFVRDGVLGRICIKGEVSNCKYHYSGHIYFSLKDENACISCIMFAGSRQAGLDFKLEDGQQIVCTGAVNVYEKGGTYSLTVKSIELAGAGDLFIRFEALKKKLYEEGLFNLSHKKPIPQYAKRVGIVTASTGAAIQDIINVSKRRNPYVELILAPAKVQGEGAAESVVRALKKLDALKLDVIIVGRGGGSIEDLWAFNEEIVARAVYELNTPVISAVGHETDTTIVDFVSDMRAPTPSAGAELAVFDYRQLKQKMVDFHSDLLYQMMANINRYRTALSGYERMLSLSKPENKIAEKRMLLDAYYDRMSRGIKYKLSSERERLSRSQIVINSALLTALNNTKNKLNIYESELKRLSPLEKISKGYGYVSSGNEAVRSVTQVKPGDELSVTVKDGRIDCKVFAVDKNSGE